MAENTKQTKSDAATAVKAGNAGSSVPDPALVSEEEAQEMASSIAGGASGGDIAALPDFSQMLEEAAAGSIELLRDVELDVKIELGRAEMAIEDILRLQNGSVVELNKLAGDPVDVLVNEQLIARGEILVVNDNFCVRINEIIPGVTEQFLSD